MRDPEMPAWLGISATALGLVIWWITRSIWGLIITYGISAIMYGFYFYFWEGKKKKPNS